MNKKNKKQILVVSETMQKIIGKGDLSGHESLLSQDIISHCPESWKEIHSIEVKGQQQVHQMDQEYTHAFHPINVTINELISFNQSKILVMWTSERFHANNFYNIKATKRKVIMGGQSIYSFNEELKINEIWHSWDMFGLLRQIDWQPPFKNSNCFPNSPLIDLPHLSLTPREKECLSLQLHGKTAKETAKLLFISPRTVEYHFENIKNKLNCNNKKEIFTLAKILEKKGFI